MMTSISLHTWLVLQRYSNNTSNITTIIQTPIIRRQSQISDFCYLFTAITSVCNGVAQILIWQHYIFDEQRHFVTVIMYGMGHLDIYLQSHD